MEARVPAAAMSQERGRRPGFAFPWAKGLFGLFGKFGRCSEMRGEGWNP